MRQHIQRWPLMLPDLLAGSQRDDVGIQAPFCRLQFPQRPIVLSDGKFSGVGHAARFVAHGTSLAKRRRSFAPWASWIVGRTGDVWRDTWECVWRNPAWHRKSMAQGRTAQ